MERLECTIDAVSLASALANGHGFGLKLGKASAQSPAAAGCYIKGILDGGAVAVYCDKERARMDAAIASGSLAQAKVAPREGDYLLGVSKAGDTSGGGGDLGNAFEAVVAGLQALAAAELGRHDVHAVTLHLGRERLDGLRVVKVWRPEGAEGIGLRLGVLGGRFFLAGFEGDASPAAAAVEAEAGEDDDSGTAGRKVRVGDVLATVNGVRVREWTTDDIVAEIQGRSRGDGGGGGGGGGSTVRLGFCLPPLHGAAYEATVGAAGDTGSMGLRLGARGDGELVVARAPDWFGGAVAAGSVLVAVGGTRVRGLPVSRLPAIFAAAKRPLTLQLVRPAAAAAGKGKEPWAAAPPRAGRAPLTVAVPGSDDDDAIPAPFLTPGDRVEARFQGSAEYYPGVLTAARPGIGTYDVEFDDGDVEVCVDEVDVRVSNLPKTPRQAAAARGVEIELAPLSRVVAVPSDAASVAVGAHCEAKWTDPDSGKSDFFDGRVAVAHADGTFRVDFDDGDVAEHVRLQDLRLVQS